MIWWQSFEVPMGRMYGRLTPAGRADFKLVMIKIEPQSIYAERIGTFRRQSSESETNGDWPNFTSVLV